LKKQVKNTGKCFKYSEKSQNTGKMRSKMKAFTYRKRKNIQNMSDKTIE